MYGVPSITNDSTRAARYRAGAVPANRTIRRFASVSMEPGPAAVTVSPLVLSTMTSVRVPQSMVSNTPHENCCLETEGTGVDPSPGSIKNAKRGFTAVTLNVSSFESGSVDTLL